MKMSRDGLCDNELEHLARDRVEDQSTHTVIFWPLLFPDGRGAKHLLVCRFVDSFIILKIKIRLCRTRRQLRENWFKLSNLCSYDRRHRPGNHSIPREAWARGSSNPNVIPRKEKNKDITKRTTLLMTCSITEQVIEVKFIGQ